MNGRANRGFTLIEIIVVVLVFSVMAAMAYGGLNSVLRTRVGIEDSFARTAAFERAYQRLRSDFHNVRYRPVRDGYGDVQPAVIVSRDGIVWITRGGWRNPLSITRASLERVSYKIEDKKLQRASFRVLDQATDSKTVTLTVLEGVEEVKWRFMDESYEWRESWPAESTQSAEDSARTMPPKAVELSLTTKDWGTLRYVFQTGIGQATAQTFEQIQQAVQATASGHGKNCVGQGPDCKPGGLRDEEPTDEEVDPGNNNDGDDGTGDNGGGEEPVDPGDTGETGE